MDSLRKMRNGGKEEKEHTEQDRTGSNTNDDDEVESREEGEREDEVKPTISDASIMKTEFE